MANTLVSIGDEATHSKYRKLVSNAYSMTSLKAYEPYVEANLRDTDVRQVLGTVATCNYFDVLIEHPAQGRGFVDSDRASRGANAVVV